MAVFSGAFAGPLRPVGQGHDRLCRWSSDRCGGVPVTGPGERRGPARPRARHGKRRRFGEWWADFHWFVLGGAALIVLALGIVGFRQWHAVHGDSASTIWDSIYKAAQLFILESGSADPPVPPLLNAARFLGLVAFFYGAGAAVVAVFGGRIRRLLLKRARGHAIVCGLGDRGLHLTEALRRRDGRGRRQQVAVIEQDDNAPLLDRARNAGAVVVIGDASDPAVLEGVNAHRAACLFAVCPEDGTNAETVVHLERLVRAKQPRSEIEAVAHIDDTELCVLLREQVACGHWSRQLKLSFFNVPEDGARAMLDAVPPVAQHPGAAPHIVVVGLGKLGRSLVVDALRRWREDPPERGRPRLTMIDGSASVKRRLLEIRFPGVFDGCDCTGEDWLRDDPRFEEGSYLFDAAGEVGVDAVYVCPDDDVHSLAAALVIQHHTRGAGVPIAVRMTREGGLVTLLRSGGSSAFADLVPVGVLDHACDPDALVSRRLATDSATSSLEAQPGSAP